MNVPFISLILAIVLLWAGPVQGAGFSVNTEGAIPLGQGNAVIAHTSDPSSVFFNPALINDLPGTQVEAGTTLLVPGNKFVSAFSGASFETDSDVFFPSTLYLTHAVSEKFSVGFGFFTNFGLATKWPEDWEGRYIATRSELNTYTFNPVVSYRITPNFSVAGGISFLFLNAELNKMISLGIPGMPDLKQTLKGDDSTVGFNGGVSMRLTETLSIGAAYRSRMKADLKGTVTHSAPVPLPGAVNSLFPDTSATADLVLPAMANFGVAYTGLPRLTLEVGGRWEGWSSYKELRITTDKPIAGFNVFPYPKNWKDTYSLNIGAKYKVSDWVSVMAGYINEGNPIPDETFDPIVPSNRSNVYSLGTEIAVNKLLFGISYAFQKVKDRTKHNAVDSNPFDSQTDQATSANGLYKTDLHMIGISLTYRF